MSGENTQNVSQPFITITTKVNIKGKVFMPNEQYCYFAVLDLPIGCGCGGQKRQTVKHYRIQLGPVIYDIPASYAAETSIPITCEDQDFLTKRADIGFRDMDGNKINDFSDLRANPDPVRIWKSSQVIPM